MQYRCLDRTGTQVRELCLGAMTFGRGVTEELGHRMLDRFVAARGTFEHTRGALDARLVARRGPDGPPRRGERDRVSLLLQLCQWWRTSPIASGLSQQGDR